MSVDSNVFIYSLICDIDFIMVILDHYLDTPVCLYLNVAMFGRPSDGQPDLIAVNNSKRVSLAWELPT